MNAQSSVKELTLHIEGIPSDEGNLRIGVYAKKLDEFRLLYDEAQNFLDRIQGKDDLLITNLTHNSPTATTLKPSGDIGNNALGLIIDTIKNVNARAYALVNDQVDLFGKLSDFCKTNFNKLGAMWFSSNGQVVTSITSDTIEIIDALMMPSYTSIGSVKGIVEAYNSHSEEKYFYIYPLVGGRVKCVFNEEQRREAASSVDKNILVHGVLKYHGGQFFPYEVDVSEIEIIADDNDLPRLADIVAENMNNAADSVQSIKRIRSEW